MLFYYVGLTWAAVFFTLGRRRIDYRVVALGALLPEALDLAVGTWWLDAYPAVGHTIAFTLALLVVVMVALRGAAARRWFVLPIATLIHLALDAMWNRPLVLFWPAFRTDFEPGFASGWWAAHPSGVWLAVMELIGLAVMAYLFYAYRLRGERLAAFLRTGYFEEDRTTRRAEALLEGMDRSNGAIIEGQSTGRPRRPEDVEEGPGSEGQGAG